MRGYQSQVKWAGRVLRMRAACRCLRLATRATLKIRARREASRAGELSRGVGLRGFESHSPHQPFSELAAFALWMQKHGYGESTKRNRISSLKPIAKRTARLEAGLRHPWRCSYGQVEPIKIRWARKCKFFILHRKILV